jgi:hypothetical protein
MGSVKASMTSICISSIDLHQLRKILNQYSCKKSDSSI